MLTEDFGPVVGWGASVETRMAVLAHWSRLARAEGDLLSLGVSTRGALALCKAAKALALVRGRTYCVPDDIKALAPVVLPHRIMLNRAHTGQGKTGDQGERVIRDLLNTVPVPL